MEKIARALTKTSRSGSLSIETHARRGKVLRHGGLTIRDPPGEAIMTTSDQSKMSRQDRIRKVLAGAQKHFPAPTTITLAGAPYTTAQLADLGQKDIAASDAATQARATWLKAVQVQDTSHAQVDPVFR